MLLLTRGLPACGKEWATRVDPKCVIAARSLEVAGEAGRSLADVVGAGAGAALGSGAFGKVGAYRYHGAAVAVKELKTGADEESIGGCRGAVLAGKLHHTASHSPTLDFASLVARVAVDCGSCSWLPMPLCFCWLWRRAENDVDISLSVKAGANVVQVYGFCFDAPDGKVRIVMELCSHGSLRAHLQSLPRDKVPYWGP